MLYEKFVDKFGDSLYVIFRLAIGAMFFCHGAQKLLGIFTDNAPVKLMSLMGLAGTIEFIGGLAILLGFWSRLAATGGAILMISAYFKAHFPGFVFGIGLFPIVNRGELALMYFASFLVIMIYGAGRLSLEKALTKKELF